MSKSVTIAVRVSKEVRQHLEDQVGLKGFSNLTDLVRDVLTKFAQDGSVRESERTEACKHDDNTLGHNETCPVLTFARNELCNRCPYREQPVVSREDANDFLTLSLSSLIKRIEEEEKGVTRPKPVSASPTDRHRLGQDSPSQTVRSIISDGPVNQGACNSPPDTGG
jgi:Arc/MetJ-type ribon-helix-helix transcriptional regulator